MSKNIDKTRIKNLNGKCSQKPLNHDKQSPVDALKTVSKNSNLQNSRSN